MKYLFLFLFLPILSFSQANDYAHLQDKSGIFLLDKEFIANPLIELPSDTLVFDMNQDSVIIIKYALQADSSVIWIHYPNMGFNDFWETYSRSKYNQGWVARREHDENPQKFISEFFKDKEIELLELIIFSSSIRPRFFRLCGSCYSGTNFLFKIKKVDYQQLCKETGLKLTILKNSIE